MFPHKIEPVEESLNKQLMEDFKGERYGFIQVGSKKWMLPAIYEKHAEKFYTYPLREDDIWIITFPRSGTTLCQELVWLLNNNLDYQTSSEVAMETRFPFFEYSILQTERLIKELSEMNNNDPLVNKKLAFWSKPVYEMDLTSPRHLKTHLPFSLLPPDLTKKCKVIYVARNPKDVVVSYYYHNRLLRLHDYKGDFKTYCKYFFQDQVVFAPYWEHVKEGWEKRNEKNVLFLFYEDLNKNMPECIRQVAKFLGKVLTESDISKLVEHLKLDHFRKAILLKENIPVKGTRNNDEPDFLRKGKVGDHQELTPELNNEADEWIRKNLLTTDLKFPVPIYD